MRFNLLMMVSVHQSARKIVIPVPLPLVSLVLYPFVLGSYVFFKLKPTTWQQTMQSLNIEVPNLKPEVILAILRVYQALRWAGSYELVHIHTSTEEQISIRFV